MNQLDGDKTNHRAAVKAACSDLVPPLSAKEIEEIATECYEAEVNGRKGGDVIERLYQSADFKSRNVKYQSEFGHYPKFKLLSNRDLVKLVITDVMNWIKRLYKKR